MYLNILKDKKDITKALTENAQETKYLIMNSRTKAIMKEVFKYNYSYPCISAYDTFWITNSESINIAIDENLKLGEIKKC